MDERAEQRNVKPLAAVTGADASQNPASAVPARRLSHEARLSMMVITLLVVAFGLLVFRKVDQRQRQLTQAAIQSPDTGSFDADKEVAAIPDSSPTVTSSVTQSDPLLMTGAGTDVVFDGSAPAVNDNSRTWADNPEMQFSGLDLTEPATDSGPANWGTADQDSSTVASADTQEDTFTTPATEADAPEMLWPDAPVDNSIGDASRGEDPASGDAPATEDFGPMLAMNDPQSEPAFEVATEAAGAPGNDVVVTGDAQFGGQESFDSRAAAESFGPISDITESEPELPPAAGGEMLLAANDTNPFGSGLDAVTSPAGRPSGHGRVRNAAGSGAGADGRFSLAAFNQLGASAGPAPDDGEVYDSVIVQSGDNYTKISKRVYGTGRYFSALAVFNQHRISEPSRMRPGMVVLTPSRDVLENRYPQLFEGSKPAVVEPAAFLILEDGSPAYRVGERETLSEISAKFLGRSSRWIEIYRLNQSIVNDPNRLKPGTILALPGDATEVSVVP